MIQNRRYKQARKGGILRGVAAAVCIVSILWGQPIVSLADRTGVVKVESAKIREQADTSSAAIGSVASGARVTITDEVQDNAGALWYRVSAEGDRTGYIRADLIEQQNTDADAAEETGGTQAPAGATVAAGEPMDAQYATVHVEAVRVRSAPSTSDTVVETIGENTQVVVSGKSNGTDGREWYYVTFTGTGDVEKSGYIRSDLLTLGEMVPVPEEPEPEQPEEPEEPTIPVNNDYELLYESEPDGSFAWYLYDHTQGGSDKKRVDQLLAASAEPEEETPDTAKTLVKQRVAIVVLVILAVILIIAVIIMALKLRDVYYEEYEDDEEEEEASEAERADARRRRQQEEAPERRRETKEEERQTRSRRRDEQEEESQTRSRKREEERQANGRRRTERNADTEPEQGTRRRTARERDEQEEAEPARKRRTKNFLLDDDEFEFEFLSMDDKE